MRRSKQTDIGGWETGSVVTATMDWETRTIHFAVNEKLKGNPVPFPDGAQKLWPVVALYGEGDAVRLRRGKPIIL